MQYPPIAFARMTAGSVCKNILGKISLSIEKALGLVREEPLEVKSSNAIPCV